MDCKRIVAILETEMECVRRADTCGRDCGKCELVMDDKELLEAYTAAINCIVASMTRTADRDDNYNV